MELSFFLGTLFFIVFGLFGIVICDSLRINKIQSKLISTTNFNLNPIHTSPELKQFKTDKMLMRSLQDLEFIANYEGYLNNGNLKHISVNQLSEFLNIKKETQKRVLDLTKSIAA